MINKCVTEGVNIAYHQVLFLHSDIAYQFPTSRKTWKQAMDGSLELPRLLQQFYRRKLSHFSSLARGKRDFGVQEQRRSSN